jgi:predicted nucleic acid-binding protein
MLLKKLTQDVAAGLVRIVELDAAVEREYGHVLDTCYGHAPAISLRTLDALHLASVRVSGETELVATDKRMRDAAVALKLPVFPA